MIVPSGEILPHATCFLLQCPYIIQLELYLCFQVKRIYGRLPLGVVFWAALSVYLYLVKSPAPPTWLLRLLRLRRREFSKESLHQRAISPVFVDERETNAGEGAVGMPMKVCKASSANTQNCERTSFSIVRIGASSGSGSAKNMVPCSRSGPSSTQEGENPRESRLTSGFFYDDPDWAKSKGQAREKNTLLVSSDGPATAEGRKQCAGLGDPHWAVCKEAVLQFFFEQFWPYSSSRAEEGNKD